MTTPAITNVTGTVQTGQTLTITGTTMMDEDKTNWGTAYQSGTKYGFEGESHEADGYDHAPDSNRGTDGYSESVFLMGTQSYWGRIQGAYAGGGGENNASAGLYITLAEDGISQQQDFYVRLYSRWNSAGSTSVWPNSHIKMLDIQGTPEQQWYFQPNITAGGVLPTEMLMVDGDANPQYSVTNFLQENRWYCMEARFRTDAALTYSAWVDGVLLATRNPSSSLTTVQYVLFNMINLGGTGADFDLTNWTDGFTVSTSRIYPSSKIEISNNSTYGAGTLVYQAPTTLSDTSIAVTCDLTGLGAGPYYLWVTNNKQERSSTYDLTGGTIGHTTGRTSRPFRNNFQQRRSRPTI